MQRQAHVPTQHLRNMENKQIATHIVGEEHKPKGYSIDELRYQLALTTLKKEFCKEKLINKFNSTVAASPLSGKNASGGGGFPYSLVGKLMKGLSYADYVMMGFSVFKTARSVFSFFKGKRRR